VAKKINIKRVLTAMLWIAMASGVVVLLVAAIGKKNNEQCKGIEIDIRGVGEYYFVDKTDVMNVVSPNKSVKGRAITGFDLRKLEETLEKNVWVKDAELFFDNKATLHVKVEEREPIARIFTVTGNSFYIDSAFARLPLSVKMSVKLPVFTGFPTDAVRLGKADSSLMQYIKQVSLFIAKDSFWTAQIAQVDITPTRTFEMVPTVGNHIIIFGNGENVEAKFDRLMIFYKNILPKVGLNKYESVNVQYEKQVIGMRRGADNRIDSLQALRNIQQMLLAARQMRSDSASTTQMPVKQMQPETLSDSTLSLVEDADSNAGQPVGQAINAVAPPANSVRSNGGKPAARTATQPKPAAARNNRQRR
jgi:cell division protein FtsQ